MHGGGLNRKKVLIIKSDKLREIEMTTHTAEILHLLIQESQGCGRVTSHENKQQIWNTVYFLHEEGD